MTPLSCPPSLKSDTDVRRSLPSAQAITIAVVFAENLFNWLATEKGLDCWAEFVRGFRLNPNNIGSISRYAVSMACPREELASPNPFATQPLSVRKTSTCL